MGQLDKIEIVIAPLPEEEGNIEGSAVKEFGLRAAEFFEPLQSDNTVGDFIKIEHLVDWDKEDFSRFLSSTNHSVETRDRVLILLVSCGPDGSVHRQVRKITKWFNEEQQKLASELKLHPDEEPQSLNDKEQAKTPNRRVTFIVALLGHSVCKTSAEQMAGEVFSAGRRLAKTVKKTIETTSCHKVRPQFLLETQVELEPPEEKFDTWLKSWYDCLLEEI